MSYPWFGGFIKKYLFLIFTLYSLKSYSGLLLEPYLGLDFSLEGKTSYGSSDVSWWGLEYGGRVGYIWNIFMVGVDIDKKDLDVTYGTSDAETEISNRGVFAGWMWPDWTLRLKYYFNADWRIDGGSSYSGTGLGLDGAYRISPHFSINLELTRLIYNDYPYGDLETTDLLISVSFPFDLVTK